MTDTELVAAELERAEAAGADATFRGIGEHTGLNDDQVMHALRELIREDHVTVRRTLGGGRRYRLTRKPR